jgi:hypothetical protein
LIRRVILVASGAFIALNKFKKAVKAEDHSYQYENNNYFPSGVLSHTTSGRQKEEKAGWAKGEPQAPMEYLN